MASNRPQMATGYGNHGQLGTPFPSAAPGDHHALVSTDRTPVDNGAGMQGVWKSLVDAGFVVKPAAPTKRHDVEVFSPHTGQMQADGRAALGG